MKNAWKVSALAAVLSLSLGSCSGSGGGSGEGGATPVVAPASNSGAGGGGSSCGGDVHSSNPNPNTTAIVSNWTVVANNYVAPPWVTVVLSSDWKITATDDIGRIYYGIYTYDGVNVNYTFEKAYYQGNCGDAALSDTLSVNVPVSATAMTWTSGSGLTISFVNSGSGGSGASVIAGSWTCLGYITSNDISFGGNINFANSGDITYSGQFCGSWFSGCPNGSYTGTYSVAGDSIHMTINATGRTGSVDYTWGYSSSTTELDFYSSPGNIQMACVK